MPNCIKEPSPKEPTSKKKILPKKEILSKGKKNKKQILVETLAELVPVQVVVPVPAKRGRPAKVKVNNPKEV